MTTNQFEIIDVHQHSWSIGGVTEAMYDPHKFYTVDDQVFSSTLSQMDNLGIRIGVISGPNNVSVEWCKRAPGRFIASWWPMIGSSTPCIEAERFKEAIETRGFRGLGEHMPQFAGLAPNDQRYYPLYSICEERGLPVFFHTGLNGPNFTRETPFFRVELCNPLLIEDVIMTFPDLKIVMAHLSFPFTDQAAYMLLTHSNVYLDIGVVNWYLGRAGFHRLLKQVIDLVGPDKILFGSDQMDVPQMIPVGVSAIQEAPFLSEEDKHKILGDNARKLLGINEAGKPQ